MHSPKLPNIQTSKIPVLETPRCSLFLHKFSPHLALAASQLAAPRTMPCLFLPSSRPRLPLTLTSPSSSCRHTQCRGHLLLPRRRPWVRLGVRVAEMARVGVSAEGDAMLGGDDGLRGTSREANGWAPVEAALNLASKWLLAGSYVFAVFWKHDVEIMWVLLGASANYLLSLILKKMLNHERPEPDLRSDPGMPSSHAQSICYAATLLVLSLHYYLGTNCLTAILGAATLSMATYLSWLRVSQRLHTLSQVVAGGAVGSAFGAVWFPLWSSLVQEALLASSLPARIVVILGSAASCVGIVVYMMSGHWLRNE